MAGEQVLTCPFCGAPIRETVPAGAVQIKCHYCGANVVVPPRLGGNIQLCPNHPENMAIGLCNDCGKSYCDRCLYVWQIEHGRLNICASCYASRESMKNVGAIVSLVFSVILLIIFFGMLTVPSRPPSDATAPFAVLILAVISIVASASIFAMKAPRVSVHDSVARGSYGPKAFLKKCVKCGEEIPIASEQCQYCGADQPEYVSA